jgi:hypothetical protein
VNDEIRELEIDRIARQWQQLHPTPTNPGGALSLATDRVAIDAIVAHAAERYYDQEAEPAELAAELRSVYGAEVEDIFVREVWGADQAEWHEWTPGEYLAARERERQHVNALSAEFLKRHEAATEAREQAEFNRGEEARLKMIEDEKIAFAKQHPALFNDYADTIHDRLYGVDDHLMLQTPEAAREALSAIQKQIAAEGRAQRAGEIQASVSPENDPLVTGWLGYKPGPSIVGYKVNEDGFEEPVFGNAPTVGELAGKNLGRVDPFADKITEQQQFALDVKQHTEREAVIQEPFDRLNMSSARAEEIRRAAKEKREPDLSKFPVPASVEPSPTPAPRTAATKIGDEWEADRKARDGWNLGSNRTREEAERAETEGRSVFGDVPDAEDIEGFRNPLA